jgi:hypothetical protein
LSFGVSAIPLVPSSASYFSCQLGQNQRWFYQAPVLRMMVAALVDFDTPG